VSQLASKQQLRMSFLRWALVMVPLLIFLGFVSAVAGGSSGANSWYAQLVKPAINPPDWVFGVVWTILYTLMGVAIAIILDARGATARALAVGLFVTQLAVNLVWSPLFFRFHQVSVALFVILAMLALAIATTFVFGRVRSVAAWLMVPYLVWLCFAAILNYKLDQLNPDAEALVPARASTHISL
jgi:translocator protein